MVAEQGQPKRISTGIEGLDEITDGGLPAGRWHLVRGGPGTGKTTLGLQFLAEGARSGEKTLLMTLEKPEDSIRMDAESIGVDVSAIAFIDLSPGPEFFTQEGSYDIFSPAEVERSPITRRIVDAVETVEPDRVFVDTLTMFRYFMADPLQFRRQIMSFMRFLTEGGATVVGSSEIDPTVPDADLQFLSSGVITLHSRAMQRRGFRTVTIEKLLGSDYRGGSHAMTIRPGGMAVHARLVPEAHGKEVAPVMLSSGTPALDEILGGGIERGSVNLLAGPTGTGKTTLGLEFMVQAAEAGERAVVYTFEEDPSTIVRRGAATGRPLTGLLERGTLSIVPMQALTITADEFASRVRHEIERRATRFIMIDSLAGFQLTLLGPELVDQIYALCKYLRNMGVTAILTREVEHIMGEFRLTEVGISYMADNIMFLRFVELDGGLRKAFGVLKKRLSAFDPTVHELTFTAEGLRIGPPMTGLRGILLGVPEPGPTRPAARTETTEPDETRPREPDG
ncbi:MAG: ATPase domain-containing protein [Gemmatimonadota bacterium]